MKKLLMIFMTVLFGVSQLQAVEKRFSDDDVITIRIAELNRGEFLRHRERVPLYGTLHYGGLDGIGRRIVTTSNQYFNLNETKQDLGVLEFKARDVYAHYYGASYNMEPSGPLLVLSIRRDGLGNSGETAIKTNIALSDRASGLNFLSLNYDSPTLFEVAGENGTGLVLEVTLSKEN